MADISCEHIVQKKNEPKDVAITVAKCAGVVLAAIAINVVIIGTGSPLVGVGLLALAGAIWLAKIFYEHSKIEYEYSFADTSNELIVDKIINLSARKNLAVVGAREIEEAGEYKKDSFSVKCDRVCNYAGCSEPGNAVYFVYKEQGRRVCIILEKDEKVFNALKRAMDPAVYRDGFLRRK
ncbi:MAG: hypothetical protein E7559_04400 [Ruminococcaceae bacterium]|nr:hypothetical protein [Oscillospiraceae bacterium]